MNRKPYALFDLDGTIFDSSQGIKSCYREALSHFGIYVKDDRELDKIMGPSLYLSFHDFFGLEGEQVTEAVKIYRDRYSAEGIYQVKMYDGIDRAIRQLRENGCVICLATTKPQVMAEKILDFSGLAPYFDIVCGAHLDGSRSDKVELIDYAMKQVGFTDKNGVVMIGDRVAAYRCELTKDRAATRTIQPNRSTAIRTGRLSPARAPSQINHVVPFRIRISSAYRETRSPA